LKERFPNDAGNGEPFFDGARGLFGQADRTQAQRFHLPQRVGPARGVKLPFGHGAVALQRSVGKGGHFKFKKHSTFNIQHRTPNERSHRFSPT
jgi:hypothetical protein